MPDNVFCGKCGELITGEPSDLDVAQRKPCPKCGSTTRTYGVGSAMAISSSVTVDDKVKRGPESWGYIYLILGLVVAIEATVIGMMTPLIFPWNIVVFVGVAAVTVWLIIENGWLHNKLIGLKGWYENKLR